MQGELHRCRVKADLVAAGGSAEVVTDGVTRNDGGKDSVAKHIAGTDHTSNEEVGDCHRGDVSLSQLVLLFGKCRAKNGAQLKDGADGPDVVEPT